MSRQMSSHFLESGTSAHVTFAWEAIFCPSPASSPRERGRQGRVRKRKSLVAVQALSSNSQNIREQLFLATNIVLAINPMHSTIWGAVKKVSVIPARPSTQRYRHWFSARFKETTRTTERILRLCLYSPGGISKLIHLLGAALTGMTVYNSLQSLHITLYKLCSVLLLAAN